MMKNITEFLEESENNNTVDSDKSVVQQLIDCFPKAISSKTQKSQVAGIAMEVSLVYDLLKSGRTVTWNIVEKSTGEEDFRGVKVQSIAEILTGAYPGKFNVTRADKALDNKNSGDISVTDSGQTYNIEVKYGNSDKAILGSINTADIEKIPQFDWNYLATTGTQSDDWYFIEKNLIYTDVLEREVNAQTWKRSSIQRTTGYVPIQELVNKDKLDKTTRIFTDITSKNTEFVKYVRTYCR